MTITDVQEMAKKILAATGAEAATKVEEMTEHERTYGTFRLGHLVPACPIAAAVRELRAR